jgi:hypothetical protein
MAYSLGTKADGGRNLIRNRTKYRQNFEEIDMSKRSGPARDPVRRRGGKVTYLYSEKKA